MMRIMTKILNRAAVLVVCLRKEQEPVLDFLVGSPEGKRAGAARWREGVSPDEFCREAKNTPTVVLVTGYGVIAKAYADGSELAAKVTKSGEFVWACELQADGTRRLAFVRRGQLDGLFRLLDEKRIPVAEVRMDAEAANAAMKETAAWQALRLYGETLSLKRVLCGDRLAAAAAGRLRLPLLLALLLLLGVNYPVSLSLQEKYNRQQNEFLRLERTVADQRVWSEKAERLFQEFGNSGAEELCPLADRIASLVPEAVVMEVLAVNPLKTQPEELKPLQLQQKYILLEGHTPEIGEVTVFTRRLSDCAPAWKVRLISLDREKQSGEFVFKIGIGI